MGYLAGFGDRRVRGLRWGLERRDFDAASPQPRPFSQEIHGAAYRESWAEGMIVLHNPNAAVQDKGRPVIRTSIDGFHRPKAERYARGRYSAEGYYYDARDLAAIKALLLAPLGPGGDRRTASDAATNMVRSQPPCSSGRCPTWDTHSQRTVPSWR
jgi:hypothetical protein